MTLTGRPLAAERDTAALDLINFWDSGTPGYRWDDLALTLAKGIGGGRAQGRALALLVIARAQEAGAQ